MKYGSILDLCCIFASTLRLFDFCDTIQPTPAFGPVMKWYFASLLEGHEDVRKCVLGTDYTSSWIADQPSLLFDSEEACCAGTGNGAFDCEENEEAPLSGDAHVEEIHFTIGPSPSPSSKPSPLPTHDPTGEVC